MTTQTPLSPSDEQRIESYRALTHNLSLTLLFICPALALSPPRRLNVFTLGLGGLWIFSANHLLWHHTQRSIWQRVTSPLRISPSGAGGAGGQRRDLLGGDSSALPTEKAKLIYEIQKRAREEKKRRAREGSVSAAVVERIQDGGQEGQGSGGQEGEADQAKGVLEQVWMGNETSGWRGRRLAEDKRRIEEEGVGYWDLIVEQVWEVWNWGKKTNDVKMEENGNEEGG